MNEEYENRWIRVAAERGHRLRETDSGCPDLQAHNDETNGHNGPVCSLCAEFWCMWCVSPDDITVCDKGAAQEEAKRLISERRTLEIARIVAAYEGLKYDDQPKKVQGDYLRKAYYTEAILKQ